MKKKLFIVFMITLFTLGAYCLTESKHDSKSESPYKKKEKKKVPPLLIPIVKIPKLLKDVAPVYPPVPKKAHIQGNVTFSIAIDTRGHVIGAQCVTGHPLLRVAAMNAVKQRIYKPFIKDGVPIPVKFNVVIKFRLPKK